MNNVDINIPDPSFGGNINAFILDLEKVRDKKLYGELPAHIFFQLKDIFQRMETLGSVRLEGNVTTLDEYVEEIIEKKPPENERQKELDNIEKAIEFIELNTDTDTKIDRAYISEIHKIVVKDLTPPPPNENEGSKYPGELRPHNVQIKKSKHVPPDYAVLPDYFQEFIKFINIEYSLQYQLLMASIANHRFAYIHPFDNGNGRTGRLLNYALLIKLGFQVKRGRIINPSSIFYSDRDKYNVMLSEADSLTDTGILN
jgi:Fic family protein